jgi:hypothetical protein
VYRTVDATGMGCRFELKIDLGEASCRFKVERVESVLVFVTSVNCDEDTKSACVRDI